MLTELLEANKEKLKNKFDYFVGFLDCYIVNHFPQPRVRQKLFFTNLFFIFFEDNPRYSWFYS